jgi:hypothetical protein
MARILRSVAKAALVTFVLIEAAALVEWAANEGRLSPVVSRLP